jgi:hypothetical protein
MSISEVKVGSLIRVKVGRNIILAKVVEILDGAVRVCSLANNKEFNVPESRVELDGNAEQPASTKLQAEAAEEQGGTNEDSEVPEAIEQNTEGEQADDGEAATVEVVPEDEAAEFTPSGEDEEDEYVINPAHESDKPKKHMSLLSAAVIVLKDAGPEHPMNCKEILEAILARQLWTPTDCKTTEQTLYGSIFREINTKDHPRIVKSEAKGKFRIAD